MDLFERLCNEAERWKVNGELMIDDFLHEIKTNSKYRNRMIRDMQKAKKYYQEVLVDVSYTQEIQNRLEITKTEMAIEAIDEVVEIIIKASK